MGLFPFRVEWVFSASKRDTQAVTEPMGDAKVELGDGVTVSQRSDSHPEDSRACSLHVVHADFVLHMTCSVAVVES